MRVRIASTKAKQRSTKAMQIGRGSKVRPRATDAEAARPMREDGDAVISISRPQRRSHGAGGPAPAMAGTGKRSGDICCWSVTGERGLSRCPSMRRSCVWRASVRILLNQGKEVTIASVARATESSGTFEKDSVENVDRSSVASSARPNAEDIAKKVVAAASRPASSIVCTLFYSRFKYVIADPDRTADHSAVVEAPARMGGTAYASDCVGRTGSGFFEANFRWPGRWKPNTNGVSGNFRLLGLRPVQDLDFTDGGEIRSCSVSTMDVRFRVVVRS